MPASSVAIDGADPECLVDVLAAAYAMIDGLGELGGHVAGGFNALFCDGSVRFSRSTVDSLVLHALITRGGGEIVSADAY
jgi:prepilin-type processing-associated H-X9-DG protein